jgi:uncharacterized membrane protein YkvA (DUF1232 family)
MSRDTWIVIGAVVSIVAIVTLVAALRLVFRLVTVKRMLGELGTGGKWAFWGAIAYLVFPIDILPDPIYLDDMAVLGGALFFLTRLLRKQETLRAAVPHARRIASRVAAHQPASTRAVGPRTSETSK